nr:MAK10-like protein [Tanacetum cinerariifolium]
MGAVIQSMFRSLFRLMISLLMVGVIFANAADDDLSIRVVEIVMLPSMDPSTQGRINILPTDKMVCDFGGAGLFAFWVCCERIRMWIGVRKGRWIRYVKKKMSIAPKGHSKGRMDVNWVPGAFYNGVINVKGALERQHINAFGADIQHNLVWIDFSYATVRSACIFEWIFVPAALFTFGWLLDDIHSTWAHLEKKQTRLRLYTKSLEEIIIQTVETASPAIATTSELDQDGIRIFKTAFGSSRLKKTLETSSKRQRQEFCDVVVAAGDKIRDKNVEESWALLEDPALYDNESWNDSRDLAKPVKPISLPQDVPSTFDRRLIELENHVQRLIQSNLEGLVSNFMASQDARLSKFEADFKQQQSEMTSKINTFLKAINDRLMGSLLSDKVKNPKLNVNCTYQVLSARSYPTDDPQCSFQIHGSINIITMYSMQPNKSQDDQPQGHDTIAVECKATKEEEKEDKGNPKKTNTNSPSPPDPSTSFITKKNRKLNSFFESMNLVPQSSGVELVCIKDNDGDVMFIEITKKYDDSPKEELGEDESAVTGGLELLKKTYVSWDHLEKKQTRLRLYTKSLEEIIIQTLETASPAIATASELDQDGVRISRRCLEVVASKETLEASSKRRRLEFCDAVMMVAATRTFTIPSVLQKGYIDVDKKSKLIVQNFR